MSKTKTTNWGELVTKWSDEDLERMSRMIHYPECWDTACYPNLGDAIYNIVVGAGCSEHPLSKVQNFGPARIG